MKKRKESKYCEMMPLTTQQINDLQLIFSTLSKEQLIWISGYLWGNTHIMLSDNTEDNTVVPLHMQDFVSSNSDQNIILISASQTGNARQIAEQLRDDFIAVNLDVSLFNAGEYKYKKIIYAEWLIFVISTYGEGEPPEEAVFLYKYLFSDKAPRMERTRFAVFSLGDKSYQYFAKAGKDLDLRLEQLGGIRFCDRVDVDIDFQDASCVWRKNIVSLCTNKIVNVSSQKSKLDNNIIKIKKGDLYHRDTPFVACLLNRQKITGRNALKDVHHLEIDITDSCLHYSPGDALGIWYENDLNLIQELLDLLNLTGNELVDVKKRKMCLHDALQKYYELTQNTSDILKKITDITKNEILLNLLNNVEDVNEFVTATPIVDMIRYASVVAMSPQELLQILRPIQPRFYSIASAQEEVGEEVHITVNVIRYQINGRSRTGGASGYLVDRLLENGEIRIFIKSNDNFRLPKDPNVSIIMIGAGTGIAPFRAFMQKRVLNGALGKNWLFFGNLKFVDDFLYQIEWKRYVRDGFLNKISTAWSRDQEYKIYVQDQLLKNSAEVWSWVQEGAHVYVCGDAKYMARDVEQALVILASQQGGMTVEKANEFWDLMRIQHRYQRDIY